MDDDIKTPLEHNLNQLLPAMHHAILQKWYLPAQIMIYSSIDAAAWLAGEETEGVGVRFRRWVDDWMLPANPLSATASELYAARCAVLHTFTSESDLSKKGSVQRPG